MAAAAVDAESQERELASSTPFFQEFHAVMRDESLGLLMRPMNELAVVEGLKEGTSSSAAKRAGVTAGSILVAVNGAEVAKTGFDVAIGLVKKAGRPVRLGFRRLHAVRDPGYRSRRMWQGYLFARFSAGRSWTGRFYVLREDGELRAYAGKECSEHVAESRVAVGSSVRYSERDVAEAARASGDLGDDGRGSLGPRALAVPVYADNNELRWEFFKTESADSLLDWIAALTTLAVAAKVGKNMLSEQHAVGADHQSTKKILRQGYLWMKTGIGDDKSSSGGGAGGGLAASSNNIAAAAAIDLATRLEPWRRRWFALLESDDGRRLVWYEAPPDDESEVPNGSCLLDRNRGVVISSHDEPSVDFSVLSSDTADASLKLRGLSVEDAHEWVCVLSSEDGGGDDEGKRAARRRRRRSLRAMESATVLKAPDRAFSLLVPVDRFGGVDKNEWRSGAAKHFTILCDLYTSDIVFDALAAAGTTTAAPFTAIDIHGGGVGSGGIKEGSPAIGSNHKRVIQSSSSVVSNADVVVVENDEDALLAALGGTNTKLGKELAATYSSARTAAKRFTADAGARVSELLYEGAHHATGHEAAATRREQVETSRRRAEPIAAKHHRLTYDAFRRYCDALRATLCKADLAWDDLRLRLGVGELEILVLKEENVADDDDNNSGNAFSTAFLTDRHIFIQRALSVKVISLASIKQIDEVDDALRLRGAEITTIPLSSDAFRARQHGGDEDPSGGGGAADSAATSRPSAAPSATDSGSTAKGVPIPVPQKKTFATGAAASERAFWDALLLGGGTRSRSDSEEDAGVVVDEWHDDTAPAPTTSSSSRHGGDTDWSDAEDEILGYGDGNKKRLVPRRRVEYYSLAFPKLSKRQNQKSRERRRHWLEAVRELVAATAKEEELLEDANLATRENVFDKTVRAWLDVRDDALRFDSQAPFFEACRRRVTLWAAINLIRRDALYRGCGKAPKALLACSENRPLLDAYWLGETNGEMFDASWLRNVAYFVSRSADLEHRLRSDVESFSPARFRDEWNAFWNHVDPIWDGVFDTIAELRRWDRPALSGAIFASLLLVALLDKLDYLPSIFFAGYAIAVVAYGERAARNRDARRGRVRARRDGGVPATEVSSPLASLVPTVILKHGVGKRVSSLLKKTITVSPRNRTESIEAPEAQHMNARQNPPQTPIPPSPRASSSETPAAKASSSSVFGQLRELRVGLGKAQSTIHGYNTTLIRCRALHRWADPKRTRLFVIILASAALAFLTLPLNFLFGCAVCYVFSDPLFPVRSVSTAVSDEYFDGLPIASRTHGNIFYAANLRLENARFRTIYPPFVRTMRKTSEDGEMEETEDDESLPLTFGDGGRGCVQRTFSRSSSNASPPPVFDDKMVRFEEANTSKSQS